MSALWRINLLVTLLFTLIAMVCLAVLLRQAAHDVKRELDAAAAVVGYLGEMAERDPDSLRPGLTDSLRHVRVRWLDANELVPAGVDPVFDGWLGAWLYPAELSSPRVLELSNGQRLQISVDPHDEVEEVRDSLLQLLVLPLVLYSLLLDLLLVLEQFSDHLQLSGQLDGEQVFVPLAPLRNLVDLHKGVLKVLVLGSEPLVVLHQVIVEGLEI